ncbi:MAG TPA: hypothetical protein VNF47_03600 [Streptosporangiaceae bacterium]|nr:hypothetical protein [Streptosporangiaceae bacterium]
MRQQDKSGQAAGADGPPDDLDLAILGGIRDLFAAADPMPADLPERIRFALALRDLEVEVARLAARESQPVLSSRGAEQSRTITFDSESLTIMIRIDSNGDGTVRVDGWLAPPQRREIEMRTAAAPLTVVADDHGRFAFAIVPQGIAQLVVHPARPDPGGSGRSVVTPALVL